MDNFKNLNKKLGLKRFLGSDLGTMYFNPNADARDDIIVRHFDSQVSPALVNDYQQLYNSVKTTIDNSSLQEFADLQPLLEVGSDYYMRRLHIYDFPTSDYFESDSNLEILPIDLLKKIKSTFNTLSENSSTTKDRLINQIISKSLCLPSNKTYFNGKMNKMILVEPTINEEDIILWGKLHS